MNDFERSKIWTTMLIEIDVIGQVQRLKVEDGAIHGPNISNTQMHKLWRSLLVINDLSVAQMCLLRFHKPFSP